jgi:deoxyribodipyrimidine photo-lyase
MNKTIIWLRNDLRLADNPALDDAYKNNYQILFLYIDDPEVKIGSAKKWFLYQALQAFQQDVQAKYRAKLVIKSGKPQEILAKLINKYQINNLFWNRIYEPKIIDRDSEIKEYFIKQNLLVKTFNSSLLFEPWQIKNLQGSYFKVFTPFWKKCFNLLNQVSNPCQIPVNLALVNIIEGESLALSHLNLLPKNPNWAAKWSNIYKVSEEDAHNIADDFIKNKLNNYKIARDFPAINKTSILSPYINLGLISAKQIYYKTIFYAEDQNTQHFLSEIGWREFSYHLLYHFPNLADDNFKIKFNNFPWENNQELLKKWQEGQTGFPLIDAGMRQLYQTGWMHNRVRMVVASFLTKNLLIDWRLGAKWFDDCLVDANLAANSASWQWVAGSGCDAAPYFRIFNPITQSQKFDSQGSYIRKWVPELVNYSDKEIHDPNNRDGYPEQITDLKASRNKALQIYKEL